MTDTDSEVDAIFSLIGFGRWQFIQTVWLVLFYLAWSNTQLGIVVLGYVPDFACIQQHNTLSGNKSTAEPVFDNECSWYNSTTNSSQSCTDGYIYRNPKHSSIVSEWDLVCGKSFLSEMSQSAMTIGITAGALVFTQLSDRFGRRRIVLYSHAGFVIVTAATAFVPNIWVFIVARVLIGAMLSGAGTISWVLTLELFIPKYRTMAALLSNIMWSLSVCTLPLIAYLMDGRSWRHLQLVFSVFSVVWIGQMMTLCESVRWLLANGKRKEALRIVKIAVKINRTDEKSVDRLVTEYFRDINSPGQPEYKDKKTTSVQSASLKSEIETVRKPVKSISAENTSGQIAQVSVIQLFRHPVARRATLVIMLAWFTNALTYQGIFMLSSTMPGDRYLNLFLNSVVEIPASIILLPLSLRFGRRTICIGYHTMGGVSMIVAVVIHVTASGSVAGTIETCVLILGKFCISSTFMTIYMYTPEVFPTNIRSIGLGFADASGRIGSFIAPFAATVARSVPWVPPCVFGILCLLVAVLCIFLPETANKELPQTLEDLDSLTTETKNKKKNLKSSFE